MSHYVNDRKMKTYVIHMKGTNQYKIGRTNRDFETRIKELQTGNPHVLVLYKSYNIDIEKILHRHFRIQRIRQNGEWFLLSKYDLKYLETFEQPIHKYMKWIGRIIKISVILAALYWWVH